ncbi:MAG: toll/interleukin-1 receptor domain-containing protein [Pseudomonadota bacterium]
MINGFISYAHEDRDDCRELMKHLSLLKRAGIADFWADMSIRAGRAWGSEIETRLVSCDIAVFLVSADMAESEYIRDKELPLALQRRDRGECEVVPILLKSCMYDCIEELQPLQPLPSWDLFIEEYEKPNQGFYASARGLRDLAEDMNRRRDA